MAAPSLGQKYCYRADPEKCFGERVRRDFLGAETGEPQPPHGGCPYVELAKQCDWLLMLGGPVQKCYRCEYAVLEDGNDSWKHRRPLPSTFPSGQLLRIKCWAEQYAPVTPATLPGKAEGEYTASCAAGSWFGPSGTLSEFACGACIQLVQHVYLAYQSQHRQDIHVDSLLALQ